MKKGTWLRRRLKICLLFIMIVGLLCSQRVGMTVLAEENTAIGEGTEIPALRSSYLDLKQISFSVSDIRNPSKVSTFNGADGKQAVIIFGSGSCYNTRSALKSITEIAEKADISNLNVYMFEVKSAVSDETLITNTASMSDKIIINRISNSDSFNQLYRKCYFATVNNSYTMPLIIYKGADGNVYTYTTSNTGVDKKTILENVKMGGLHIELDIPVLTLGIEGNEVYTQAYKVLEMVNKERNAVGLGSLVMDEDLLDAAMLRAAECVLYYSHTRPNGEDCFSASSKMSGENIAIGYTSAEAVMNGWMNSPGHKANILNTSFQSIGIGCFYDGYGYTWTQCFGRSSGQAGAKRTDRYAEYDLSALEENANVMLEDATFTLDAGEKAQLNMRVVNQGFSYFIVDIDPDSYTWSSDSDVVKVDAKGLITAKKAGSAVVTGVNKGNSNNTLTCLVTVNQPNKVSVVDAFSDIKSGAWYVNAIQYAYDYKIMKGRTDGTFAPNANITRADFATILYNMRNNPNVTAGNIFKDVADGKYYTKPVLWAYENGIAQGYPNGNYGVADNIQREQLALMLYRYGKLIGYDLSYTKGCLKGKFVDENNVSSWAVTAMEWAVSQGIMSGKGNASDPHNYRLDPKGNATRAECASMIMKLLEKN